MSLLVLAASPKQCTPEQIDTFCELYTKVIVQKGDGSISATPGVKRRLLANELLYRNNCPQAL